MRSAVRSLRRRPAFALAAILTVALGVGANTALFSVIYAVLIQPLPFRDPGKLVRIWETHPALPQLQVTAPDFRDWRSQTRSFDAHGRAHALSHEHSHAAGARRAGERAWRHGLQRSFPNHGHSADRRTQFQRGRRTREAAGGGDQRRACGGGSSRPIPPSRASRSGSTRSRSPSSALYRGGKRFPSGPIFGFRSR